MSEPVLAASLRHPLRQILAVTASSWGICLRSRQPAAHALRWAV
jgi:hypothetical protein